MTHSPHSSAGGAAGQAAAPTLARATTGLLENASPLPSSVNPTPVYHLAQPPSLESLRRRSYSGGALRLSRGHPQPTQWTTPPATLATKRRTMPHTGHIGSASAPPADENQPDSRYASSTDPPIPSSPGGNRQDHVHHINPYGAPIPTPHPSPTLSVPTNPIQHHLRILPEYDTRYSASQTASRHSMYPPMLFSDYYHADPPPPLPGPTSCADIPFQPLPHHSSEPRATSSHAPSSAPISMSGNPVGDNTVDVRRSPMSPTIISIPQMSPNVGTDRYMTMNPTRESFSIPMSTTTSLVPSASTSMPMLDGGAFEFRAHANYTPLVLPPHLAFTALQQRSETQQSDPPQLPPGVHAPQAPPAASEPLLSGESIEAVNGMIEMPQSDDQIPDPQPPARKKKKSKMHRCTVCGKQFPRPSGLYTHMNTHSNAKPYPCTFPGCDRAFGVRSNAKRHLRTHGVTPGTISFSMSTEQSTAGSSTKNSYAVPNPPPYVVGFSEPVIVGGRASIVENGEAPSGSSVGDKMTNETGTDGSNIPRYSGPSFFKLRWLPLSLTSRTNAAALRNASEWEAFEDEGDDEEQNEGGAGESSVGGYDDETDEDHSTRHSVSSSTFRTDKASMNEGDESTGGGSGNENSAWHSQV